MNEQQWARIDETKHETIFCSSKTLSNKRVTTGSLAAILLLIAFAPLDAVLTDEGRRVYVLLFFLGGLFLFIGSLFLERKHRRVD